MKHKFSKPKYIVPRRDAAALWNIVADAAVASINTDAGIDAEVEKFRRRLDAVVLKKIRGMQIGRERRRFTTLAKS